MTEDTRNYVAAWVDWDIDKIVVLERDGKGNLHRRRYNPPYYFYIPDEEGEYESIFGHKLTRAEFDSRDQYEHAKNHFPVKFESDIPPLKRVLMDYYYDKPAPLVNYAFLDIEVDYSQEIGFSSPTNPYAPINAVTIYQSWTEKYITYVVPPPGHNGSVDDLNKKIDDLIKSNHLRDVRPEITICADEMELLIKMLQALEDADIISGWNSEFFDIPYICERIIVALGERALSKLDYVGVKPPKRDSITRFGTEEPIWNFNGKSHLDYMRLFQKFTFEGRVSYSLGNILQEEVGVGKLEYDGTLEQLYKNDFPTFVAYNFRDVDGIVQLDQKFKFIALANQMAHENTVHFSAVLGTVAYVETGITNHAHYKLKKIVHDKHIKEHDKVEGAIVLTPKVGLHEWIGSVDIKSLYPNTIRSLNISPEMIVGQFTAKETAWRDIREGNETRHTLILENGEQHVASSAEWKAVIKEQKWAISGYGTVFDQGKGKGVVADILSYWYSERKRLQAEKKKWAKKVKGLPDGPEKEEAKKLEEHYDLLQLTKKISMNSLYGALLNVAFRFGDERMGASVTATGRQITTFMMETIGEFLTGERKPLVKTTFTDKKGKLVHNYHSESEAVIYGDTDSCYYKTFAANKAEAIEAADLAAAELNAAFPQFMRDAFNCQEGFDTLIEAGREVVGVRGLFQTKKKYMIKVVDLEGMEVDKLKTQGSEIKKADTPKIIQEFLKKTVDMILGGESYDDVAEFVCDQRKHILKGSNVFSLGVAKQVNNLDAFLAEYNNPGSMRTADGRKLTIPGHVRAALNYNRLLELFDKGAKTVKSGDKVAVYYVKKNQYGFDSIGIPSDLTRFPKWFTENFTVDRKLTEQKMFDNKLEGIFEALGKDVPSPQSMHTNSILEF